MKLPEGTRILIWATAIIPPNRSPRFLPLALDNNWHLTLSVILIKYQSDHIPPLFPPRLPISPRINSKCHRAQPLWINVGSHSHFLHCSHRHLAWVFQTHQIHALLLMVSATLSGWNAHLANLQMTGSLCDYSLSWNAHLLLEAFPWYPIYTNHAILHHQSYLL